MLTYLAYFTTLTRNSKNDMNRNLFSVIHGEDMDIHGYTWIKPRNKAKNLQNIFVPIKSSVNEVFICCLINHWIFS